MWLTLCLLTPPTSIIPAGSPPTQLDLGSIFLQISLPPPPALPLSIFFCGLCSQEALRSSPSHLGLVQEQKPRQHHPTVPSQAPVRRGYLVQSASQKILSLSIFSSIAHTSHVAIVEPITVA